MDDTRHPHIWVLADDRTGDVAQCLGVAEALGRPFAVKDIRYTPLARLTNVIRRKNLVGIRDASRAHLVPPWPRVVIACGRRTAPVARWIKRRSGAFLVQIMDPGPPRGERFDLICAPSHDRLRGPRVLSIVGAPHRVTPERLAAEADQWAPRLAHLPRPYIMLSVGGATRHGPITPAQAGALGAQVSALAQQAGGSVLLTTSRRTGRDAEDAVVAAMAAPAHVHRWDGGGDNPYFGFLGLADHVVVTGESVSMLSEACATTVPVYIWAPQGWIADKYVRFHHDLYAIGAARPLDGVSRLEAWTHARVNPAPEIARAVLAAVPGL
jgi:hypothetical protein